MSEYIDLHCHYLPGVDDGARSTKESRQMLLGLGQLGFAEVVATPHMRPGLFDNDAASLRETFANLREELAGETGIPQLSLSAEHYFDDIVFARILSQDALPYSPGHSVLLEFYDSQFPFSVDQRLADIHRRGLTPVIAHPERYKQIADAPEILERLLDLGAVALLDVAALVGKYGRLATRTAERLLDRGLYRATCSDAHRPKDVEDVARGIDWIRRHFGDAEVCELLVAGPRAILAGSVG